jgi:hypothetical protein
MCSPQFLGMIDARLSARDLARALAAAPVPSLCKSDLQRRWQVSDKTVTAILKDAKVAPSPSLGRRPRYSFLDVLRVEGALSPERLWADASGSERDDLLGPLLTAEDVAGDCGWLHPPHVATVRRWAEAGDLPAIRLGGQWRFRPSDLRARLDVRPK